MKAVACHVSRRDLYTVLRSDVAGRLASALLIDNFPKVRLGLVRPLSRLDLWPMLTIKRWAGEGLADNFRETGVGHD